MHTSCVKKIYVKKLTTASSLPNHFTGFTKSLRYSRDSCTPLIRSVCIDEPESLVSLVTASGRYYKTAVKHCFTSPSSLLPLVPSRFPLYPTFRLSAERNARAFGRCGNDGGARASVSTFHRRR